MACLGCGHARHHHVGGTGLCLVGSCRLCLIYRPAEKVITSWTLDAVGRAFCPTCSTDRADGAVVEVRTTDLGSDSWCDSCGIDLRVGA